METVTLQYDLRPELPNIYGTFDYQVFRDTLIKMDEILTKTDLEDNLISQALGQYVELWQPRVYWKPLSRSPSQGSS